MPNRQLPFLLQYLTRATPSQPLPTDRELLDRFARQRDESAFAELVARHGVRVLSLCRGVLRHEQDAEDVFQATFLVLARKAGTVAWRDCVGNWLHEVAVRLAREALRRRRQRQADEAQARQPTAEKSTDLTELCLLLHEEVLLLPPACREPVRLCYFEGQTRDQAARQLGCSLRTVERQLQRGRALLHDRLIHHGVTLSAALVAVGALSGAAVPASLIQGVVWLAAGAAPPAAVTVLAESAAVLSLGVGKSMTALKVWLTTALLFVLGGTLVLARGGKERLPAPLAATPTAALAPAPLSDRPLLQGVWSLEAEEKDGKVIPPAKGEPHRKLIICRDYLALESQEPLRDCTFTLDVTTRPKRIDIVSTIGGKGAPWTWDGIYEVEGKKLRLCLKTHGPRPTAFATSARSGGHLMAFVKIADDEAIDTDRLNGAWRLVRLQRDGKDLPAPWLSGRGVVLSRESDGPRLRFTPPRDDNDRGYRFHAGIWGSHCRIDLTRVGAAAQRETRGIYTLVGPRFVLCVNDETGPGDEVLPRPQEFRGAKGARTTLYEFERLPRQTDLELLAGGWELVREESDGQRTPDARVKGRRLVVMGQTWDLHGFPHLFKLDEKLTPRGIELTALLPGAAPPPRLGIYDLKGDRLLVCVAGQDVRTAPRPKAFQADVGSGVVLQEFRREPPPTVADEELLQGVWRLERQERHGKPIAPVKGVAPRLQIDGKSFHFEGYYEKHTFEVRSLARPRQLAVQAPSEGYPPQYNAIYEVGEETFKVCIADLKNLQPAALTTTPAENATLFEFRRVPDARSETRRLQGVWRLSAEDRAGKPQPVTPLKLAIHGDRLSLLEGAELEDCTFTLDPTQRPPRIDVRSAVPVGGFPVRFEGVYERQGSRLFLSLGAQGGARPAELKQGARLLTFERLP